MSFLGQALGNLGGEAGDAFVADRQFNLERMKTMSQLAMAQAMMGYRQGQLDLGAGRLANQQDRTNIYGQHANDVSQLGWQRLSEQYRAHGLMQNPQFNSALPASADNQPWVPVPREQMTPQEKSKLSAAELLPQMHQAQLDLTKARTDYLMNPNNPQYQLRLKQLQMNLGNLQQKWAQLGQRQLEWEANIRGTQNGQPVGTLDEQGNPIGLRVYSQVGPSTASRSRADAARAMGPLIDHASMLINAYRDQLGVLPGRVAEAERSLGNMEPGLAELYGTLKSIYSLGGTMHGWRALQVAQEFEKAYGGLHTDPETLLGGLQSMKDTAATVQRTGETAPKGHSMKPIIPPAPQSLVPAVNQQLMQNPYPAPKPKR